TRVRSTAPHHRNKPTSIRLIHRLNVAISGVAIERYRTHFTLGHASYSVRCPVKRHSFWRDCRTLRSFLAYQTISFCRPAYTIWGLCALAAGDTDKRDLTKAALLLAAAACRNTYGAQAADGPPPKRRTDVQRLY